MLAEDTEALVAEVGCGAGRVTKHLHDTGLRIVGLDLYAAWRRPRGPRTRRCLSRPRPRQRCPSARACWEDSSPGTRSSTCRTGALTGVFAEFARATRPGAPVLVAFQCGDGQRVDRTTSYSQPVPLTYYRHRVDEVESALEDAGFALDDTISRAAALWFESTPQAALLAHRNERR